MIKLGLAVLLTAGTFIWLGGTSVAQQTTQNNQTQNQTSTSSISDSTKQFLTTNSQDSVYELVTAQLAIQKAQSPQVEQLALTIFNDHAEFQRALLMLARQYNLNLPVELSSQDRSRVENLSSLQGAAFDREYTQDVIQANVSSVSEFQREASLVNNEDVKNFVNRFLRTQQEHLRLANSVMNDISSTTGSSGSSGKTGTTRQ